MRQFTALLFLAISGCFSAEPSNPAGSGLVSARVVSIQQLPAEIANHQGRIVILDLWALW